MHVTLYLFKHCDLITIKHFKTFTDLVVYLIDTLGGDTYKKMEKFYDKHNVFKSEEYIGVMTNYKEEVFPLTNEYNVV